MLTRVPRLLSPGRCSFAMAFFSVLSVTFLLLPRSLFLFFLPSSFSLLYVFFKSIPPSIYSNFFWPFCFSISSDSRRLRVGCGFVLSMLFCSSEVCPVYLSLVSSVSAFCVVLSFVPLNMTEVSNDSRPRGVGIFNRGERVYWHHLVPSVYTFCVIFFFFKTLP